MGDKAVILEKCRLYLSVLIACKSEEIDLAIRKEYDQHIEAAERLMNDLAGTEDLYKYLPQFFESQGRAFGRSYLPNTNGAAAEKAFLDFREQFDLNPNPTKLTQYQLSDMTVNERLVVTGMLEAFEKAKKADKNRAAFILRALHVDEAAVKRILE